MLISPFSSKTHVEEIHVFLRTLTCLTLLNHVNDVLSDTAHINLINLLTDPRSIRDIKIHKYTNGIKEISDKETYG